MSRIEKYMSNGKWYWRFRHTNGNIMADGSEGYEREAGVDNALRTLRAEFGSVPVYRPGTSLLLNGQMVRDDSFPTKALSPRI